MAPTTILVNDLPRCVVRPVDMKALQRFIRNGRGYLLRPETDGRIAHREASAEELARWREAFDLHMAWGGDEDAFFGIPL